MPVSARQVANEFIRLARKEGKYLTNLQVQKLSYIAHGFYLALLDEPLYAEETEAWKYGPIVLDIYDGLARGGRLYPEEIRDEIPVATDARELNETEKLVIQEIWKKYRDAGDLRLVALTYRNGTPWEKTWKRKHYGVIPLDDITAYYKGLLGSSQAA